MNEIELLTRYSHEFTEDTLRCKLYESLRNILIQAQEGRQQPGTESILMDRTTVRSTSHFNDSVLQLNLQKIDWDNVCSQYDSNCTGTERYSPSRVASVTEKSTMLEILLNSFSNPSIWPGACVASTFRVLIGAMLHSTRSSASHESTKTMDSTNEKSYLRNRSEWTPSQHRILDHLTQMLRINPSMQNTNFWTTHNSNTTWLLNVVSTGCHGEIVLRILRSWFVEFPDCSLVWISLLSKLIAKLDAVEASLVQNMNESGLDGTPKQQVSDITRQSNTRKRSLGHSLFDFQMLHGESCAGDTCNVKTSESSLSQFASSPSYFYVQQDTRTQGNTNANNIVKLWKVKASSVDFLLTCTRRVRFRWNIQNPIPFQPGPIVAILHQLLDIICLQPNAATLKLCCVLVTKAASHEENDCDNACLDLLLSVIWWRATNASSKNDVEVFAHLYCELIKACPRYNCQQCLMKAITPLLTTLNIIIDAKLQQLHIPEIPSSDVQKQYRKAFAIVLSIRASILVPIMTTTSKIIFHPSMEEHALLLKVKTKASFLFYQPNDWIDPDLCSEDRSMLLKGLQQAGIIGIDPSRNTCCNKTKDRIKTLFPLPSINTVLNNLQPWLFEGQKTVRSFFLCDGCNHSEVNSNQEQNEENFCKVYKAIHALIASTLPDDILLNIFNYLSYKRLVRIRLVCKHWKTIADSQALWCNLYMKRYKQPSKILQPKDLLVVWKKVFMERHEASRGIKHLKCRQFPNWRIRLCQHFNCLKVLKTPESAKKHRKVHYSKVLKPNCQI